MVSPERIKQLEDAVINHLNLVGSLDWEEVKKDFLDIPTSSFWRHVKRIKEQVTRPAPSHQPVDLFTPGKQTSDRREPWEKPNLRSTFRMLEHAQRFYELHADILALRQHALDANGNIRDSQLFAKTIRLRNQLLNDELSVVDEVHSVDLKTKFFEKIIDTVSKVDPEAAKSIMIALGGLSEEAATMNF